MPRSLSRIRRALLSVTNKSGIAEFARDLAALDVEILSTGGTFRVLKEAGIARLREVSDVTQFPEMLDGRVKTIHPAIAGGILAMRANADHMRAIQEHGIPPIDLVCVNLYEFEKVASNKDAPIEELIENIDIGGPTMIRAAAKNYQDVAVVTSPEDYQWIIDELRSTARGPDGVGSLSAETHWKLAKKAFSTTAAYDGAVSARLEQIAAPVNASAEPIPATLDIRVPKKLALRYGENPHQSAALYASGRTGIAGATQIQGKELSYNNLVDLDAAWQLIAEFDAPAAAIVKHTNPCGCAEASSLENSALAESYRRALEADPISAYGGVLAFNRAVDSETATEIAKIFTEAIAAPDYSEEALRILGARKNLRVLRVTIAPPEVVIKSISGGFLAQTPDAGRLDRAQTQVKTQRTPSVEEWVALEFGWKVAKHVKSNAIVYARAGQSISVGAGQMSRVDSVKVGALKAILPLEGTVLASDAFFPFADGVEEAAKYGITAVIQPGGSVRDDEVIAAADRLGLAMVFTGIRHFRH